MYKRRARVLFIDAQDAGLARRAVQLAARHGGEWVEARASTRAGADAAALAWADLVVELGPGLGEPPPVPVGTRAVCWPVGAGDEGEPESLEARVRGMIGGMRLLARGRPPRG